MPALPAFVVGPPRGGPEPQDRKEPVEPTEKVTGPAHTLAILTQALHALADDGVHNIEEGRRMRNLNGHQKRKNH